MTVPDKLVEEVKTTMEGWGSVISLRELRAVTGRLSWLAGVLTKTRCAVSIMDAVIASAERAKDARDSQQKVDAVTNKVRDKRIWFTPSESSYLVVSSFTCSTTGSSG